MFSLRGSAQSSCLPLKNVCKILQSSNCPLELRMMPIGNSALLKLLCLKNSPALWKAQIRLKAFDLEYFVHAYLFEFHGLECEGVQRGH